MSAPDSLAAVYADEMRDLWSANEQMSRAVRTMAEKASEPKLRRMLEKSVGGIDAHTATLKSLVAELGEEGGPEHCKGMEGLVREALRHAVEEAPADGVLRDAAIIAQYQRMSHYGIAGFGTAAAYAGALGREEHVARLKEITSGIYEADAYTSALGERLAGMAAGHDAAT